MNNNPFNLMYGRLPMNLVDRGDDYNKIINDFLNANPSTLSYIITGVRGSGKTVLLRKIANEFQSQGWLVLDINPQSDIIYSLSQKLYYEGSATKLYLDWKLVVGFKYLQLEISKSDVIRDPEVIFEHLLNRAKIKKKKVLITIDEVNNRQAMRTFANFYQSLIGKGYDVFLLMTGLKDNVDALLNSKAASFLSRTPKVNLGPLDIVEISDKYKKLLNIKEDLSIKLAKLTKGYAFAYQVLGYLCYENKYPSINQELLKDFDNYMRNNSYDVIWKNLTKREKELCIAYAMNMEDENNDILKTADMKMSNYQNYRLRLIEQGIIFSEGYNKISFALPRFKEFVLLMKTFSI